MKIQREINGTVYEIELTPEELRLAYYEKQHLFDVEDIRDWFDAYTDDELMNSYRKTPAEIEDLYEDMANEMRRNIDKYDMSWEYARNDAILTVLARDNDA